MDILGYLAAILIGISLGLIGGGGSILTVPVMVYLLHINPVQATAYSLFVVGITSLIGAISYAKRDLVSYKTAILFSIPSMISVFLTRRYLMPALPEQLFNMGTVSISKDTFIMTLFALLMIAVFISMISKKPYGIKSDEDQTRNYPIIIAEGLVVGALTGFLGAGGGFLIIPSLVIFSKLKMKLAVGTSLLIIAIKSLTGFAGDISIQKTDWEFLILFSSISISGIYLGSKWSGKLHGDKLRNAFGWFVLVMGVFILIEELIIHNQ